MCGGHKVKTLHHPLKPPLSHAGKAKVINETMLPVKKNPTASHTQHRAPPILSHISIITKEWGHEKKKGPTSEVRNTGKI